MSGCDGDRLKELLGRDPVLTLAVAESVTSGGLQQRLGRISGVSRFFLGGLTAYDRAQKFAHLGIDDADAREANCVSDRIAAQMARGVCVLFNAAVGVATTGYAEPNEEWQVPAPFAYWAIARETARFPAVVAAGRIECAGLDRAAAQDRMCDEVLVALVRQAEAWRRAGSAPTA